MSLQTIPGGLTGNGLTDAVNKVIRSIAQQLGVGMQNPATAALSMTGLKITNLANPTLPADALNLQTADARYLRASAVAAVQATKPTTTTTTTTSAPVNQLSLSIPGVLAIESNAADLIELPASATFSSAVLLVKQAPVGGSITLKVSAGGGQLGSVTIPAGQTSSTTAITWSIPKNSLVTVDVTSVGLTYPGSDLSLLLR